MLDQILGAVDDGIRAIEQLRRPEAQQFIHDVGSELAETYRRGNKLIVAGNGGSLCDASHFAEELTGFFRGPRPALPAISLAEPGHLTCVGNDIGFDYVFSRGVEAYGQKGDMFVGLTTSGNSSNILKAVEKAKQLELTTVCFLGKTGGALKGMADFELLIEGFSTSDRIQEAHMTAIHILIQVVEAKLFAPQDTKIVSQPVSV